jgi:hypothetical protein
MPVASTQVKIVMRDLLSCPFLGQEAIDRPRAFDYNACAAVRP